MRPLPPDLWHRLTPSLAKPNRPFADNEVTLKEYRDRADAGRRAEERATELEADGPPQQTSATILYRFDTAGTFIVGDLSTREVAFADRETNEARQASRNPEAAARIMAAELAERKSYGIEPGDVKRWAAPDEMEVCWTLLDDGRATGSTKELGESQRAGFEPWPDVWPAVAPTQREPGLPEIDENEARLAAEADNENAGRYAAIFNEEGRPSPSITTWQATKAIAEENGFSLEVAEPQLDPNCLSYTLTDQPGRPGFHTPLTFDVQSPQAAYDTLRYALSLWSGKDIAANEPGLPQIGATVTREDDEPRRRATDRERAGPTSRIEKDMIQGLGRKIEREQREIYHTEGMDKQEKSDALDANLARNIEAWGRPAVTAARALDAGRVLQAAPLLQQMRDSLPKDKRDAANKLCAELDARRANSNANSDDYAVSG